MIAALPMILSALSAATIGGRVYVEEGPYSAAIRDMLEEELSGTTTTSSKSAELRATLSEEGRGLRLRVEDAAGERVLERPIERAEPLTASLRVVVLLILRAEAQRWRADPASATPAPIALSPSAGDLQLGVRGRMVAKRLASAGLAASADRSDHLGATAQPHGLGLGCCSQSTTQVSADAQELWLTAEVVWWAWRTADWALGGQLGGGVDWLQGTAKVRAFSGTPTHFSDTQFVSLAGLAAELTLTQSWRLTALLGLRLSGSSHSVELPPQGQGADDPLRTGFVAPLVRLGVGYRFF
jgi:hypothetical protein